MSVHYFPGTEPEGPRDARLHAWSGDVYDDGRHPKMFIAYRHQHVTVWHDGEQWQAPQCFRLDNPEPTHVRVCTAEFFRAPGWQDTGRSRLVTYAAWCRFVTRATLVKKGRHRSDKPTPPWVASLKPLGYTTWKTKEPQASHGLATWAWGSIEEVRSIGSRYIVRIRGARPYEARNTDWMGAYLYALGILRAVTGMHPDERACIREALKQDNTVVEFPTDVG